MKDNTIVAVCACILAAGVTSTIVTGAWQPSALGACACWLGAEYMTHRARR